MDMTVVIDYLLTFGDKFIGFLYNLMFLPVNEATDVLFRSIPLEFQTFSGQTFWFRVPDLGILGTIFDTIVDVLFLPNTVIGWFTGVELPFIISLITLMFWIPIVLGILRLAVSLVRSLIGLS